MKIAIKEGDDSVRQELSRKNEKLLIGLELVEVVLQRKETITQCVRLTGAERPRIAQKEKYIYREKKERLETKREKWGGRMEKRKIESTGRREEGRETAGGILEQKETRKKGLFI